MTPKQSQCQEGQATSKEDAVRRRSSLVPEDTILVKGTLRKKM